MLTLYESIDEKLYTKSNHVKASFLKLIDIINL